MNYLHTSRTAWVASAKRLASGGGYLSPNGSPAAADTLHQAASPAAATTSTPVAYGDGGRLTAHEEVLTLSLLRSEDKTIQERGCHLHGVRRLV